MEKSIHLEECANLGVVGIIGAGHNALVCACYLAKAGHDVMVLERRHVAGGRSTQRSYGPATRIGELARCVTHRGSQ